MPVRRTLRTMKTLIVVESHFGNTRTVAEAIARGLRETSIVDVVAVGQAPPVPGDDVDLLLVGGPTHAFSMSRPQTRDAAAAPSGDASPTAGGTGEAVGIREWLAALPAPIPVPRIATFGTTQGHGPFTGSAAKAAGKAIRGHGMVPVECRDFHVTGRSGPLDDGELERAVEWGRALAG